MTTPTPPPVEHTSPVERSRDQTSPVERSRDQTSPVERSRDQTSPVERSRDQVERSRDLTIRPYRPTDFDDVSRVCLLTAATGHDATGIYANDDLMPDIFARPYLVLEPEWAFVVDDGDAASGYILCAPDTRSFVTRYREEWLPAFAEKYAHVQPPVTGDEHIRHLGFWPERMLIPEVDEYPAHLHIDVLPHLQGRGLGRQLIETLVDALRRAGVPGLHLTLDPANTSARAFYDRLGFVELPSSTPSGPALGMRL